MSENPLDTNPKSVAIVGLGPSISEFFSASAKKKDFLRVDEVWVVNSALDVLEADKAFIMDDLKDIKHRYPEWDARIRQTKTPVITCNKYDDYPNTWVYPLEEVCECIKDDFFTTTPSFMIGYAIYKQVRDLYLFGVDFWYPGGAAVESGLSSVSYLLGIARERGVNFKIPDGSTLLDAHMVKFGKKDDKGRRRRPLYGYDYNPGDASRAVQSGNATPLEQAVADRKPTLIAQAVPPKESRQDPAGTPPVQAVNQ